MKIRYGDGKWRGWVSQKQTLDGANNKSVRVGGGSLVYARVQMKVPRIYRYFIRISQLDHEVAINDRYGASRSSGLRFVAARY